MSKQDAKAKEPIATLPVAAKIYVTAFGICGVVGLIGAFHEWTPNFTFRFFIYLLISMASSGMKVTLPGVPGSISVNYVATLLAMLQFTTPETLLLAIVSVISQTVWHARTRMSLIQIFFNISSITMTVLSATYIYRQPWFTSTPEGQFFRLLLSGVVYFMMNALSVCIVIALSEKRSIHAVWKEYYRWSFPFYMVGASLAEMVYLSIDRLGWTFTIALLPFLYVIHRFYKVVIGKMEQEKEHAKNVSALHLRTIETLAMAIEAKDECTHDHLRRVQVYSLKTAEALGLSPVEIEALRAASILHDIGKLAVPDHIISKPGKLTPEEFDKMKVHTVVGAKIVEQVRFPYDVAPIVRSHHEKWDGTGYPDGLKAEEIPIGARILSAVDCLDALATDRQYRRALPLDEAMEYVVSLSGRSFDPKVIDILKDNYREFEASAQEAPQREFLDTAMVISHGQAPDAGFQKDRPSADSTATQGKAFAECMASARHELQMMIESMQCSSGCLHLDETLSVLGQRLKRIVPHDAIVIWVRSNQVLKPLYLNGESHRLLSTLEIPVGDGISGWVAEHDKPIVNGNAAVETAYLKDASKVLPLNSALAIPLASDQLSGVLTLYRADRDAFSRDELRLVLAIEGKVARFIDRARRAGSARKQDAVDELTGLPNAKSFYLRLEDEIGRAESQDNPLTLIVCDIDGFAQVNDRFGHLTGNELLNTVGRILKDNCRHTDCVARMGGDEFVMLLCGPAADLDSRIDRISRAVNEACREVCGDEKIGVSLGVAAFPNDGHDPESLLSHADNDMYRAKRARKSSNVVKLPRVIQVA